MPEFDFLLTISGVILARTKLEADFLLHLDPTKWGQVDIEQLDEIPEEKDDDPPTQEPE